MEEKIIIFRNRIEIKILTVAYVIIFIPSSILLIITAIKTKSPELLSIFAFVLFFLAILYIINRFRIVFNYEKEVIKYTGYFSKTESYTFKDIKVRYEKSRNSLPNDCNYVFLYNNKVIFKISSINFEGQTKKSINYLNQLFTDEQRIIYCLKDLNIKDGYIGFYTYELAEQIATAYLYNNITIKLGYNQTIACLKLIVFLDNDINKKQEELEINEFYKVKYKFQELINKYNGS